MTSPVASWAVTSAAGVSESELGWGGEVANCSVTSQHFGICEAETAEGERVHCFEELFVGWSQHCSLHCEVCVKVARVARVALKK